MEHSAENDAALSESATEILARVRALAEELAAFDILTNPVPAYIDVPDDYEFGIHDAAFRLRAALDACPIPPAVPDGAATDCVVGGCRWGDPQSERCECPIPPEGGADAGV